HLRLLAPETFRIAFRAVIHFLVFFECAHPRSFLKLRWRRDRLFFQYVRIKFLHGSSLNAPLKYETPPRTVKVRSAQPVVRRRVHLNLSQFSGTFHPRHGNAYRKARRIRQIEHAGQGRTPRRGAAAPHGGGRRRSISLVLLAPSAPSLSFCAAYDGPSRGRRGSRARGFHDFDSRDPKIRFRPRHASGLSLRHCAESRPASRGIGPAFRPACRGRRFAGPRGPGVTLLWAR